MKEEVESRGERDGSCFWVCESYRDSYCLDEIGCYEIRMSFWGGDEFGE